MKGLKGGSKNERDLPVEEGHWRAWRFPRGCEILGEGKRGRWVFLTLILRGGFTPLYAPPPQATMRWVGES